MQILDISHSKEIYSVSALTRDVRLLLENNFTTLWVEGEVSNVSVPQSGHWYFSLKDAQAQVRCAMFKPHNRHLNFLLKDGMQILMKARVSLYEPRGDFQLLVEFLEEAGVGKLRQAFDALKKRLAAAGLFDAVHKKPLPLFPNTIGIITSPTGAAIRDILSVLKRRYPCANVIVYPSVVQGDSAAEQLVQALHIANQRCECDVIILARGGGSLEDLWPFNEERVAHAIFQSEIPIVSGVGHEIDFTIADFVADLRAPTPSAAAELIVSDMADILRSLHQQERQLAHLMRQQLSRLTQQLHWTEKQLHQQHPQRKLTERMQQLDLYELALVRLQKKIIQDRQHQLHLLAGKLDALSPLATLQRGFAIATRTRDQHVLRHASEVSPGDAINIQLMDGNVSCQVVPAAEEGSLYTNKQR